MNIYKLITGLFLLISTFSFSQTIFQHKVTKGESIYSIAKKYGLKENDIYKLNPKVEGKLLQLNTILQIYETSKTEDNNLKTHVVVAGETINKISKKYHISNNLLLELNPTIEARRLKIGSVLNLTKPNPTVNASVNVDTLNISTIKNNNPKNLVSTLKINDTINSLNTFSTVQLLIENATKNLGTRYKTGGTTSNGFDCSGLIVSTFKKLDINLPRTSKNQAKVGDKINKNEAKEGDLIFFSTRKKGVINHVGIITEIINNEIKFIHASTHLGVIISSIKESYYAKRFVQINRVFNQND